MGTHPIFESDFDCLTDRMSAHGLGRVLRRSQTAQIRTTSQYHSRPTPHHLPIKIDGSCAETRLVPVTPPLCPLYGYKTEEEIDAYLNERFDELISAFSTSSVDMARRKRRGLSDNHYHLIKLNEKLKAEIPTLLYPYFEPHDYSIYDEDVEFVVNAHPKSTRWVGKRKVKGGIYLAKTFIQSELKNPVMDVVSSKIDKRNGELRIKWRVHGKPRLLGNLKVYTFISILRLNGSHKVYRHEVTNMEIDQGKMQVHASIGALALGSLGIAGVGGNNDDEFSL